MSRYIDADLMREKAYQMNFDRRINERELFLFNRALSEMPTVDAVPVVRCRECKYCYSEGFVNVRNVCEKHYDFGNVDDDWFCADGERRSE